MDLKQRPQSNAVYCSALHGSSLFYTTQEILPRDVSTDNEQGPATSIINQEKRSTDLSTGHTNGGSFFFFSWGSLLPNDQNCVKLTDSPAQTVFLSFWEEFCHHSWSLVANFSFVPWKLDFLGLRALTLPRLFIQELPQPTLFQLLWPSQQQQKVCLYGVKLQLFSSLP